MLYLYIGAGGFFGAVSRYAIGNFISGLWGGAFPLATFVINLAGCFLLGLLMSLSLEIFIINPNIRIGIATGFLGGLTTFSTFTHEALTLINRDQWGLAAGYVLGSLLMGVAAVWLGMALARLFPNLSRAKSGVRVGEPGEEAN